MYERILFPLLRNLDAEVAHERTLRALAGAQNARPGRWLLNRIAGEIPAQPIQLWGLTFPNRLGVAAGFDKNARVFPGLGLLGFGHVEVGTITPWPQEGNPHPRLFRLPEDRALINRMGFPNEGMVAIVRRLQRLRDKAPEMVVGVSLGKQKETALDRAIDDYVTIMRAVHDYADYLAINISSPNTPGLRQLQGKHYLSALLGQLLAENRNLAFVRRSSPRPVIIKIAPDLTNQQLDDILEIATHAGVDGIIAGNTSIHRGNLSGNYPKEMGGLSGAPLAARNTTIVKYIHRQTNGNLPIIAAGGIFTAQDVAEKIAAGAVLVQMYTGLVYRGPGVAGRILRNFVTD